MEIDIWALNLDNFIVYKFLLASLVLCQFYFVSPWVEGYRFILYLLDWHASIASHAQCSEYVYTVSTQYILQKSVETGNLSWNWAELALISFQPTKPPPPTHREDEKK